MKTYALLIFSTIILAFTTGYSILLLKGNFLVTASDLNEIKQIKHRLPYTSTLIQEIDFSALYPAPYKSQLLGMNRHNDRLTTREIDTLVTSKNCSNTYFPTGTKMGIWDDFRCKRIENLPEYFFETPPFLHTSGNSFAFLGYLSKRVSFLDIDWIEDHLDFFRLAELSQLRLDKNFLPTWVKIITNLSEEEIAQIAVGENYFSVGNYLFERVSSPLPEIFSDVFNSQTLLYRIYDLKKVNLLLEESSFHLKPFSQHSTCLQKDGLICWEYNFERFLQMANKGLLLFVLFSVLLLAGFAFNLYQKYKSQKEEEQRKRLALQVLGHEMRTPVTSIILSIETINENFQHIPEVLLEPFLRISNESFRLKRLIEKSRQYLQVHTGKDLLHLKIEHIPDLGRLISDIIADYPENIINLDTETFGINTDKYWITVAIRNLIENALRHGKEPILIKALKKNEFVTIKISDHGICDKSLDELKQEFFKGANSQGSGLGLSIVDTIIKTLDGRLSLENNPTTFTITLANRRTKNEKNIIG